MEVEKELGEKDGELGVVCIEEDSLRWLNGVLCTE